MSGEVIYSVFVSSTFDDLREERGELQKALLKSKCFPIGMELFPSSDDETWDFIKRQIDDADYYIVIIAGRYGSLGPQGISYTEMEYDYARTINKPILAFIHGAPGTISSDKSEQDPAGREKLDSFKTKVRRTIVNTYTNSHELAMQVMASLVDLKDRRPAVGFVRPNQMIEAKKYAELLEDHQALKTAFEGVHRILEPFPGSDEELSVSVSLFRLEEISHFRFSSSLAEIFVLIAEAIIDAQNSDARIAKYILAKHLSEQNLKLRYENVPVTNFKRSDVFLYIRRKFFAFNLVDLAPEYQDDGDSYNMWKLTSYGQEQYGLLVSFDKKN